MANNDSIQCTDLHQGKLLLNEVVPVNVDQLFTMLFTSSKFYLDFHASRKTTNLIQTPWTHNPEINSENRVVNMTYALTQSIGPKTSQVTETQRILPCSKAGIFYAIDVESVNAGIPYADSFYTQLHYCLKKVSDTHSSISVHVQLIYKKKLWDIVKSMLEKNVWAGVEEFFNCLKTALLENVQENVITLHKSKKKSTRRLKKHGLGPRANLYQKQHGASRIKSCYIVSAFILLSLVVLNMLLYSKLRSLEEKVVHVDNLKNVLNAHDDSVKLSLENYSLGNVETRKLKEVLKPTLENLRQAEEFLNKLKNIILSDTEEVNKMSEQDLDKQQTKTEL